ncbi:MAG: hypothetical protein KUG77_10740 [Nannocystaceae bacterium]|nr:hypothetical protein [Nannocystaceae bacterium]
MLLPIVPLGCDDESSTAPAPAPTPLTVSILAQGAPLGDLQDRVAQNPPRSSRSSINLKEAAAAADV